MAARDLTEKLAKRGVPLFEHFLAILGKVAQTGEFQGTLGGIEEKRNLPSRGELRGHWGGVFGHWRHSTYKIDPPVASELTPRG